MKSAWQAADGGLKVRVQVSPKSSSNGFDGVKIRDDGAAVVCIRLRAAAQKGAANQALIALVANQLGIPKSAVRIRSGQRGRSKLLIIVGEGDALAARLKSVVG